MRGLSLDGLGIAAGAAFFGLAIFIGPMLGGGSDHAQDLAGIANDNPFADERWDGEWEHRPSIERDLRYQLSERAKSIDNFVSAQRAETSPILAQADGAPKPPEQPFLRIETEQHSARLTKIDVAPEHGFMISGGFDKAVRVWSLPKGKGSSFELLRVLRPPISDGEGGKIYAVSISPDGETIAAGGWTWGDTDSVFLFDRSSGRLIRELPNVPEVIQALEFSDDGQFLAAALGGRQGVRIWNTSDWSPVVVAPGDYRDQVYGLSFGPDGRLATGSTDGAVRVYSSDFQTVGKKENAVDGAHILGVAFSPDGTKVAASSGQHPQATVLDSQTLEELYRPDVSDLPRRERFEMSKVTWSPDSTQLMIAGQADLRDDMNFIRVYEDAGRGPFVNHSVSRDNIAAIVATEEGVYYGAMDPIFGLVDYDGTIIAQKGTPLIDVRGSPYQVANNLMSLRIADDAMTVSLPYNFKKQLFWRFSVDTRRMETLDVELETLNLPKTTGLNLDGWINGFVPTLDGEPLSFTRDDMARVLAIAPDESAFILGTDFYIIVYEKDGKVRWRKPGPGVGWKVNISADGAIAVVHFGDGTVRWYDMRNGDELLALFVTNEPENPRWVAWTPSGYYDASPGAEDLIGWHINQGADQEALFFPASRFRDLYYRPEIIRNVLKTRTVEDPPSREKLLAAAPPIITILGERVLDNGDVIVDYEARTIFGEEIELEVYVDDAKLDLAGARYAVAPAERQSLTVPRGGCARNLSFVVKTADGRRSEAETITRGGAAISTNCAEQDDQKPNLHALIIGVSDYARNSLDLDFAHQDAEDFAKLLEAQEGNAFEKVTITTLVDGDATKGAIEDALAAMQDNVDVTSNDATVFFFAGHGVKRSQGGNALFFLPHNADMSRLASTAVNQTRFVEAVTSRVGRKFIFLDACFSNFGEQSGLGLFDMQGIANTLGGSDIRAEVFSSSTGDQVSFEHEDWENGAFTEALLEGLQGGADYTGDDNVTNDELNLFVKSRVRSMVREKHGAVQTPTYTAAGSIEFPLAHVYE